MGNANFLPFSFIQTIFVVLHLIAINFNNIFKSIKGCVKRPLEEGHAFLARYFFIIFPYNIIVAKREILLSYETIKT